MLSFFKKYWFYVLIVVGHCYLSLSYFLSGKDGMGAVWLASALFWGISFFQRYKRDQKNKK